MIVQHITQGWKHIDAQSNDKPPLYYEKEIKYHKKNYQSPLKPVIWN